ncbi:MAG: hypothetical protein J5615_01175 [Fibrobacter sp.]|jgi:hypothetical protein|nr:hypothetical protein [Fibrobacter sp.]
MKNTLKLLSISAFAAGMMTLSGCGDDSPTHIEFDESFEMVLSKASYYYHSKDSLLVITAPECKASTLGYVVWNRKGEAHDSLKAYRNGEIASIRKIHENNWTKFEYNGKSFPAGVWYEPKAVDQNIMNAKRFLKNGTVESVFRYEGKCFASSLLHQLMNKNSSIEQADSALAKFYVMFQPENDRHFDAKEMMDDLRAPKCNKLTMYSGDVSIGMNNFTKNSGTITLGYGKKTCNIKFKLRNTYEKKDCEAAFGDYQDDKAPDPTFDFDKYSEDVDYDIYCIKRLVLNMQEEKKILPKKQAGEYDADAAADEIARSAVRAVLSGMKAE